MVGVSGAGFLGLAAAYPTQEYPFLPNTSYFTRDIFTQPFAALGDTNYYDLADLHCNFMVRATGIALNPDDPNIDTSAEPQAVKGYNLYRFPESQMEDVDSWTLLNESPVSELSYKDASFADAQEGRYRYAVKAVYPGEDLSAAIFSTVVEKDEQDTTSVEYGIDNEFRVYPNPADERLYVEGDVEEVYKRENMYEKARKYWKVNVGRAQSADYVLAVYEGIVRAVMSGRRLAADFGRAGTIISSPLLRALQTAQIHAAIMAYPPSSGILLKNISKYAITSFFPSSK